MITLIDCRADTSLLSALKKYGFEPLLMPSAYYLQGSIASHTDMLIFIGFGRLFCHMRYYESNTALIDSIVKQTGLELSLSHEPISQEYPNDVLFNTCVVGKNLICNKKTVSKLILDAAIFNNYEIINVSQGYTKCSVCVVSDNAIITADKAISKACAACGIDVLTVSEGGVSLPPYNYGFIGGASGLCGDKVFFCGSVNSHPDSKAIVNFCHTHGKEVVSLSDNGLIDVGTIFFM